MKYWTDRKSWKRDILKFWERRWRNAWSSRRKGRSETERWLWGGRLLEGNSDACGVNWNEAWRVCKRK